MGIPRFYRQWLEPRNYAGVISQQMPTYVSSLLIDMNAIVHEEAGIIYAYAKESTEEDVRRVQATHPAYLEESLFKAITQRILSLLEGHSSIERFSLWQSMGSLLSLKFNNNVNADIAQPKKENRMPSSIRMQLPLEPIS